MSMYVWGRSPLLQLLNRAADSKTHAGHCTGPGIRNMIEEGSYGGRETLSGACCHWVKRTQGGSFLLTK